MASDALSRASRDTSASAIVRKQEVADDEAQRAAPQRQVRLFERRERRVAGERSVRCLRDVQRLRLRRRTW